MSNDYGSQYVGYSNCKKKLCAIKVKLKTMRQMLYKMAQKSWVTFVTHLRYHRSRIDILHVIFLSCLMFLLDPLMLEFFIKQENQQT